MRTCIFGLGAVGGLIAARLARSGVPISAVARGATLDVVRRDGLLLIESGVSHPRAAMHATDKPAELGPQDLVIITLKGQALPSALTTASEASLRSSRRSVL